MGPSFEYILHMITWQNDSHDRVVTVMNLIGEILDRGPHFLLFDITYHAETTACHNKNKLSTR